MLEGFGLAPVCLELDLDSYEGDWRHVARFRGRSGWLTVAEANLQAGRQEWATTLVAACDEWGEPVPSFMAPNLLACACSLPKPCADHPPAELDKILQSERGELKRRWVRENNHALRALDAETSLKIESLEAEAKRRIAARDAAIADLRRRRRIATVTFEERALLSDLIQELEDEQDVIAEDLASERAGLRSALVTKERALLRKLEIRVHVEPLYYVQWRGCASMSSRGADSESLLKLKRLITSFCAVSPTRQVDPIDVDLATKLRVNGQGPRISQLAPKIKMNGECVSNEENGASATATATGAAAPEKTRSEPVQKLRLPAASRISKSVFTPRVRREAADIWLQSSRLVSRLSRANGLEQSQLERLAGKHHELREWTEQLQKRLEGASPTVLVEASQNLNAAADLFAARGITVSDEI